MGCWSRGAWTRLKQGTDVPSTDATGTGAMEQGVVAGSEPAPCLTRGMDGGGGSSLGARCPHHWPMGQSLRRERTQGAGF